MDNRNAADGSQITRFKKLASDLGLEGDDPESFDRAMEKLDLIKKPEPKPGNKAP